MGQKEKITEHYNVLYEAAADTLVTELPSDLSSLQDLMAYIWSLLDQKAGDKVDLESIENRVRKQEGEHKGNELLRFTNKAVNQAILDMFGPSFYGKGKGDF